MSIVTWVRHPEPNEPTTATARLTLHASRESPWRGIVGWRGPGFAIGPDDFHCICCIRAVQQVYRRFRSRILIVDARITMNSNATLLYSSPIICQMDWERAPAVSLPSCVPVLIRTPERGDNGLSGSVNATDHSTGVVKRHIAFSPRECLVRVGYTDFPPEDSSRARPVDAEINVHPGHRR